MHPAIKILAERYVVQLSDRVSYYVFEPKNYILPTYDGQTLSTQHLKYGKVESIPDIDLLHEIGHYVAASQEQRDLPEYGLGTQVYGRKLKVNCIPAIIDKKESEIQEFLASFLAILWGRAYGIKPASYRGDWNDEFWPHLLRTEWEKEPIKSLAQIENCWLALYRFQEWKKENWL